MTTFIRWMLVAALIHSIAAYAQPIPPDLKIGADFLWHVANAKTPADVYKFKDASLPRDNAFDAQLKKAHKTLLPLQGTLEPAVDVIKQYYLERGEQLTVFRVQSKRSGSRVFEIHILGANRPPRIVGIKELDTGALAQRLAPKEILSIPQGR